jgi:hypothetical protein
MIEYTRDNQTVEILPPGEALVERDLGEHL